MALQEILQANPNLERSVKKHQGVDKMLALQHQLYNEKKKARTVQTTFDKFFL